jgi:hypothetical protein
VLHLRSVRRINSYADDYNGTFPPNRVPLIGGTWTWKRAIQPYLKSFDVWKCPGVTNYFPAIGGIDQKAPYVGDESNPLPQFCNDKSQYLPASYGYSGGFFFDDDGVKRIIHHLSDVKEPSGTLFIPTPAWRGRTSDRG